MQGASCSCYFQSHKGNNGKRLLFVENEGVSADPSASKKYCTIDSRYCALGDGLDGDPERRWPNLLWKDNLTLNKNQARMKPAIKSIEGVRENPQPTDSSENSTSDSLPTETEINFHLTSDERQTKDVLSILLHGQSNHGICFLTCNCRRYVA